MTLREFPHGRFGLAPDIGNQRFKFDYTHHLHPIPNLKCRNGRWCAEEFKGFHLGYLGTLEEAGEISCEIIERGPFGTYKAKIKPRGFLISDPNKTMYPKHWKFIDIVKANREAILSSRIKFETKPNLVKTLKQHYGYCRFFKCVCLFRHRTASYHNRNCFRF